VSAGKSIVLFDGGCGLCSRTVGFVMARDPGERFRFVPLQSPEGQDLLARHGVPADLGTVVLLEEGRALTRSTAALGIARRLRAPWPLLGLLLLVPRPLRDAMYDVVARRRYRWFGAADACRVPTPELRSRSREPRKGESGP